MRWSVKLLLTAILGFAALDLAVGQPQGQFPGMGGKGKGGQSDDPVALLQNPSVKKELHLTEEQSGKVSDAVWKALAGVLDPDQLKRLKQIDLQVRDVAAFADPKVQTQLKMTDDQKDDIKTILADAEKTMKEMAKEAKGGGFNIGSGMEKLQSMRQELKDKCLAVLDRRQKVLWQEMTGEEFKMESAFGFPGADKKGKKKGGND